MKNMYVDIEEVSINDFEVHGAQYVERETN